MVTINQAQAVYLQQVKRSMIAEAYQAAAQGFAEGINERMQEIAKSITLFLTGAQNSRPEVFRAALENLGEAAAFASAAALQDSKNGPYRVGAAEPFTRYGGGILKEAVQSRSNYSVAGGGLRFGNVALMERANRGWARLNFGIGDGAAEASSFPVSFLGGATGALTVVNPRPESTFLLPEGYFTSNGDFWPLSYLSQYDKAKLAALRKDYRAGEVTFVKRQQLQHLRGKHYIEAGVEVIAEGIGPATLEAIKVLVREALDNAIYGERGALIIDKRLYKYQLQNILRA